MKTCVIYAASIFEESKLSVVNEFFTTFKEHFGDATFYIGVNYGSIPNLEEAILSYGLNCKFLRLTNQSLYTKTDASAYQAALALLKHDNPDFDIYWCGHTKGAVNTRPEERRLYLDRFFSRRAELEKLFETHPHLGSWGIRGNARNSCGVWWRDYNVDSCIPICGNVKFDPFNYTHVNWSYIETMYLLKKEPVEAYVKALPEEFFLKPLNPWYFETVLPWVPSRCGYFPYVEVKRCFWNVADLPDVTKKWIDENNLPHLMPYLEL